MKALVKIEKALDKSWILPAVFLLYVMLYIAVTIFHEPWFDEGQAWEIAKYASIQDIIFLRPHYEGHPPLWHLILAIPAKLGVPYEVGLKSVGLVFSALAAWLVLFKSPFPRVFRILIPFTYFAFYQYGVVTRPYCLMMVAICLIAITFAKRNEYPLRFVLSLVLLCLCSAYGIVIAGGIAIAWVIEILREKGSVLGFLKDIPRDRRLRCLVLLLAVAVVLIALILPRPDTYGTSSEVNNPLWVRLLYMLFCCVPDAFLIQILPAFYLREATFDPLVLAAGVALGVVFLLVIAMVSGKGKLKYFAIPYVLLAVFAALVYFAEHHIGIMGQLVFCYVWITVALPSSERFYYPSRMEGRIAALKKVRCLARAVPSALASVVVAVSLFWNASASVLDVQHEYCYARGIAEFLTQNNLEGLSMMVSWDVERDGSGKQDKTYDGLVEHSNTHQYGTGIEVESYFEGNIKHGA